MKLVLTGSLLRLREQALEVFDDLDFTQSRLTRPIYTLEVIEG